MSGVFDVGGATHAAWVEELSRAQTPPSFGKPTKAAGKMSEIAGNGVAYFTKNGRRNKTTLADAQALLDADAKVVKSGAQLCAAFFVHGSLCTGAKCKPAAHDKKAVSQATITQIHALATKV